MSQSKATRQRVRYFVDTETGARVAIPQGWDLNKIEKVLGICSEAGRPQVIDERCVRIVA